MLTQERLRPYGNRKVSYPEHGTSFGLWKFIAPGSGYDWMMLCSCGTERSVRSQDLRLGSSTSCGCSSPGGKDRGVHNRTHGVDYGSKVYRTWRNAKNRCFNQRATKYLTYGALGITMCPEWADSFEAFAAHIGEPPSLRHSIDRKDNTKGYEPGNVRWATAKEQSGNRQLTIKLLAFGVVLPMSEWAEKHSIAYSTLKGRLKAGWNVERSLTEPLRKKSK